MPAPLLTDAEKVKIRAHMGYLNVQEAYTFVLGVPASLQTQFIIEGAMDRVLESAMPELRRLLVVLDTIEAQKVDNLELLAVSKLGEIETRENEQAKLDNEYDKWLARLENLLGCVRNPYDKRTATSRINVGVAG